MGQCQHGKYQGDWVMDDTPLFDRNHHQAVPVQAVVLLLCGQPLCLKLSAGILQTFMGPTQQEFACQSTAHIQHHRAEGKPGQPGIEVDARMYQHQ